MLLHRRKAVRGVIWHSAKGGLPAQPRRTWPRAGPVLLEVPIPRIAGADDQKPVDAFLRSAPPAACTRPAGTWVPILERTGFCMDSRRQLLLLGLRRALSRKLSSRSFSICSSLGQPNQADFSPRRIQIAPWSGVPDVMRRYHAVSEECVPAALASGASFLARRADQRLPVHRLQVDLEAGLTQQLRGHVRQFGHRGCRSVGFMIRTGVPS